MVSHDAMAIMPGANAGPECKKLPLVSKEDTSPPGLMRPSLLESLTA
eukprot:CAMPEP_0180578850 /NCGR_PEP_ID=MMETSP1037_2-20121125/12679_1 /TAXON_ID=632150 /ORGANISM="Azadinium spinosum, Strain 3D9" /LENGTH=46 /DNA_ID= /DNA_START= /DNA_END= /DNA_ORIENTATION=